MTVDTTLFAGVYSAASWFTTAGTTLTLDGQGQNDAMWLFNIEDILAFGGVSTVELSKHTLPEVRRKRLIRPWLPVVEHRRGVKRVGMKLRPCGRSF
jgi:hypothetical protein